MVEKRKPVIALVAFITLIAALTVTASQRDSRAVNVGQQQDSPMRERYMGMMRSGMMGQGMMGRGGMSPGMMRNCMMESWAGMMSETPWDKLAYNSRGELLEPLSKKKAEEIAQFYLDRLDNPRLKIGKIKDNDTAFEVEIVTRDNSLVNNLLVEKDTGIFYLALN